MVSVRKTSFRKSTKTRTTRQIMNDIIKVIKTDNKAKIKAKIKKLRKEYFRAGYILSDNDLKRLMRKHSKKSSKKSPRKSSKHF